MNYILTGTNAYPHKFSATNTKLELLSIGLIKNGDKCTIIDNMVGTDFKINKFEGISSTGIPYINIKKKHNRIISWLINMPNYCNLLNRLKSDSDKNIFICTQPDFLQLIIYSVICKIKGFLFISIYHEWPLALNMPWYKRFSSVLYVKYFGYLCDAILPISEALIDKCKPFNKPIFTTFFLF